MNTKMNKNEIYYVIVLILTMITMIVGITFTFYNILSKEKDDGTKIEVGTIDINYIDGKEFNAYDLLPINEPNLNSTFSVYKKKFSIESRGTLEQTFSIAMKINNNEFDNYALKYSLYDSNNIKIAVGNIPNGKDSKIIMKQNINLKSNETQNYTVLIWLQENNKDQDYEQGHKFSGSFEINSIQKRN